VAKKVFALLLGASLMGMLVVGLIMLVSHQIEKNVGRITSTSRQAAYQGLADFYKTQNKLSEKHRKEAGTIKAPLGVADAKTRGILEKRFAEFLEKNSRVVAIRNVPDGLEEVFLGTYGTGFFVSGNIIATANHVVTPDLSLRISRDGDIWSEVSMRGAVRTLDLGFLEENRATFLNGDPVWKSAKDVFEDLQKTGEENVSLSRVLVGMKCMVDTRTLIGIGTLLLYDTQMGEFIFILKDDIEGCSGAPLFLSSGEIIGIVQNQRGAAAGALDIEIVMGAREALTE